MDYTLTSYRSAKTLSLLAIAGLALTIVCKILGSLIGIGQVVSPDYTFKLDGNSNSSVWLLAQGIVALLQFPVFIFTVVFFLIWLNRANKNLEPLKASYTEFSSGWAVGWWFIPFANLVKPFQVVREVWRESDPEFDGDSGFLSSQVGAPTYMGFWWGFWIVSNIFENITSRVYDPDKLETVEISGYLFIISGIFSSIAAFLAIMVVRDITARQETRIKAVGTLNEHLPPPPPQYNGLT